MSSKLFSGSVNCLYLKIIELFITSSPKSLPISPLPACQWALMDHSISEIARMLSPIPEHPIIPP